MSSLKSTIKAGVVILVVQLLVVSHATAADQSLTKRYLKQPALVFTAADMNRRQLPWQTRFSRDKVVHSNQIMQACTGNSSFAGELLVFLPESNSCLPLSNSHASQFIQQLGLEAFAGLSRDKAGLTQQLGAEQLIVLAPHVIHHNNALACVCPLPELLFGNSFEDDI